MNETFNPRFSSMNIASESPMPMTFGIVLRLSSSVVMATVASDSTFVRPQPVRSSYVVRGEKRDATLRIFAMSPPLTSVG